MPGLYSQLINRPSIRCVRISCSSSLHAVIYPKRKPGTAKRVMECNRITFGNSAASLAVSKAFCVKNSYDWSMTKIRCGFCFIQAVKTSFSLTSPVGLLGLHNHINLPLSGKRFKLYIGTTL